MVLRTVFSSLKTLRNPKILIHVRNILNCNEIQFSLIVCVGGDFLLVLLFFSLLFWRQF